MKEHVDYKKVHKQCTLTDCFWEIDRINKKMSFYCVSISRHETTWILVDFMIHRIVNVNYLCGCK